MIKGILLSAPPPRCTCIRDTGGQCLFKLSNALLLRNVVTAVLVQLEGQGGHPAIKEGASLRRRPGLQHHRPDPCNSAAHAVDVIEFLWTSLALFDDNNPGADTTPRYRPRWLDIHSIPDARLRILRRLSEAPDGQPLERLLPNASAAAGMPTETALRTCSAWTSTFVASLELAKQGEVALAQMDFLGPIHVRAASAGPLA